MIRTLPVVVLVTQIVAFAALAQGRIEPEPLPPLPPAPPSYGAPSYGAPSGPPSYGAPSGAPSYGAPSGPPFYGEPPGPPSYGMPSEPPSYGAPSGPQSYGAPPASPYEMPPRRFDPPPPPSSVTPEPPAFSDEAPTAAAPPRQGTRVFCDQDVSFRLADRAATPEPFWPFVGIWSDASWTPQVCAALIVEKIGPDGLASIIYAFGPMGSNARVKGGVLHGTGIVRNGELRFQNSDGSQYAFRTLYADLEGKFTTPQGQTYQAIFKKTF